jgi:Na+/H+ antiporter NhaD/arsenite permease-like protein
MTGAPAVALSAGMLVAVLAFAVVRAKGWPEAVAAVPAAVLVVAAGAVSPSDARAELGRLLPVVGFLAAVLVLATLRDHEGVFPACGAVMARMCRGRPLRLFGGVFVVASLVAAVLSLDATVVLLTPVVFATAASLSRRRTCRCGEPAVSGVRPGAGRDRPRVGGQRAGLARRSGPARRIVAARAARRCRDRCAARQSGEQPAAVLVLVPVAAAGGSGPVFATLIGVNVGPNLTYVGSLAPLWRRVVREHDAEPTAKEFTGLGLLTVRQ